MHYIKLHLFLFLVHTLVVLLAAYITPGIKIRSFGTAIWIALLIAILNPTIGWFITGLLHVATLGVFWVLGLGFILRFLAFVIVLRIISVLVSGFETRGFGNTLAFAIVLAVLGTLVNHLMMPGGYFYPHELPVVMINLW